MIIRSVGTNGLTFEKVTHKNSFALSTFVIFYSPASGRQVRKKY